MNLRLVQPGGRGKRMRVAGRNRHGFSLPFFESKEVRDSGAVP